MAEGMDPMETTACKSDVMPEKQEAQHWLRNPIDDDDDDVDDEEEEEEEDEDEEEEEEEEGMDTVTENPTSVGANGGLEQAKVGETNAGKHLETGFSEGKKLSHMVKDGSIHLLIPTATRPTTMPTSGLDAALAQLTIFYAGSVGVFNAVPAEKAREIMVIAAAATTKPVYMKNNGTDCGAASPVLTRSPSLQSTAALASPQSQHYPAQKSFICKLQAELPVARRHSLQRFFEKRRDRLVSKAPYPTPSVTTMTEGTKTNLGAEGSPELGCFNMSN